LQEYPAERWQVSYDINSAVDISAFTVLISRGYTVEHADELLLGVTWLYSFYYDLVCKGRYIWEIEEMHKQYGLLSLQTAYTRPNFHN
jgi:hypothetical protein